MVCHTGRLSEFCKNESSLGVGVRLRAEREGVPL